MSKISPVANHNKAQQSAIPAASVIGIYRQTSDISRTLISNIVYHSDVVGAAPVGATPTTSSF